MLTIKTEEDYTKALKRLNEIFEAKVGTPESDEANRLTALIEQYEASEFPDIN